MLPQIIDDFSRKTALHNFDILNMSVRKDQIPEMCEIFIELPVHVDISFLHNLLRMLYEDFLF